MEKSEENEWDAKLKKPSKRQMIMISLLSTCGEKKIRECLDDISKAIDLAVDERDKIIADAIINFIKIQKERGYDPSTTLNNISNQFILADIIKGR